MIVDTWNWEFYW